MTTRTRVRAARPEDVPAILGLVRELAEYEREPDAVEADEGDFRTALFGPAPRVHAFVAEVLPDDDTAGGSTGPGTAGDTDAARWETHARIAGTAVWFVSFSTWRGRHGIWLEDLFVRPVYRGLGLGQALLAELAAECERRGYARLEWNVLDWNEPALGFYRRLGAEPLEEWTVHRLTGDPLRALARQTPDAAGTAGSPGTSPAQDRR
ncbi:GNAT family N-acetyltransferase [Kineosporia sp. A_224]|uniref:GNAT family N-acetyltransferase n=1 Tax=Kineosporia sp. A_224 TaxID=1962180 RepID=UPI000B4B8FD8|nr:GNAT family N-acetyltransferase [Kineosporia sp. A_224]